MSKHDASLQALYQAIQPGDSSLLLADEHSADLPALTSKLVVISNRADVATRFSAAGFECHLSDFDFSVLSQAPRHIFYRVSKEKALVHFLINQSLSTLPVGGKLILSGEKGDGFKTYYDKARALVGASKQIEKCGGGAYLGVIEKRTAPTDTLDDNHYTEIQDIAVPGEPPLYSKPGVYGWKKVDKGSALLIEALGDAVAGDLDTVLDLGCGYGYLSVEAHKRLPEARFVATDNNVAATAACQKNFAAQGIRGDVIVADCAETIDEQFDLVLCNPPFHKGFDIQGDLTAQFLVSAASHLKAAGEALFVVNQFIGLEQRAESVFSRCELVTEGGGFKVYRLRKG